MRIIGGNLKGQKIFFPQGNETRPLRDLVKESIFNIINNSNKFQIQIEKSIVLDLFSGTGSFGLECISRGANKVYFVENHPPSFVVLNKNIEKLKVFKKCDLFNENCFSFFNLVELKNKKFDLIFLDPPYKEKNINSLIDNILNKKLLNSNGILIIHRHKKDDLKITPKLKILDTRLYGISKILIGN
tara:strand:- start:344 stop:904 length:561 start_codon:yes stop_codon:yes gene_type:complete